MKNVRSLALSPIFLLVFSVSVSAQSYLRAVGVRADKGFGFTFQQYLTNNWTAEVIGHTPFRTHETGLSILAEKHQKLFHRSFNVYYGGGGHYYWKTEGDQDDTLNKNVFGLSGILGAEITLGRVNVSVDFKPELHLAGDQVNPFEWPGTAVSVRYVLAKRPKNRLRDWDGFDKFKKKKGRRK